MARSTRTSPSSPLLQLLDEAYDRRSWHGTNLRGSLRGLSMPVLSFRPGRERHSIWEIALHAAYWKYTVRRTLLGEKRGSFPLPGSNWFPRPSPGHEDERAWRLDLALLDEVHRSLREAVAQLDLDAPAAMERLAEGRRVSVGALVRGIVAHDLYHAGQIQLLKRLATDAGRGAPGVRRGRRRPAAP